MAMACKWNGRRWRLWSHYPNTWWKLSPQKFNLNISAGGIEGISFLPLGTCNKWVENWGGETNHTNRQKANKGLLGPWLFHFPLFPQPIGTQNVPGMQDMRWPKRHRIKCNFLANRALCGFPGWLRLSWPGTSFLQFISKSNFRLFPASRHFRHVSDTKRLEIPVHRNLHSLNPWSEGLENFLSAGNLI